MCYWREKGRHALNFQQADFERAAREYEQLAMSLDPRQCQERNCWQERMHWNKEQNNPGPSHQVTLGRDEVSQAMHRKSREEICLVKQIQNFKDIKASKTYNAICLKFKKKSSKASKLRVEKKWKI